MGTKGRRRKLYGEILKVAPRCADSPFQSFRRIADLESKPEIMPLAFWMAMDYEVHFIQILKCSRSQGIRKDPDLFQ